MWLMVMIVLNQAEPMSKGGAAPHAPNDVRSVEENPGTSPCTVQTLHQRTRCTFDGKPTAAGDQAKQSEENRKLAGMIGNALCRDRAKAVTKGRGATFRACAARVQDALRFCALDGFESLLDATGQFSPRGQSCYVELAWATQPASAAGATDVSHGSPGSAGPPEGGLFRPCPGGELLFSEAGSEGLALRP